MIDSFLLYFAKQYCSMAKILFLRQVLKRAEKKAAEPKYRREVDYKLSIMQTIYERVALTVPRSVYSDAHYILKIAFD